MPGLLMEVIVAGAVGYGMHRYRHFCMHQPLTAISAHAFDGIIYQVGATDIAIRHCPQPSQKTVICFPGFLENQRYFLDLYNDAAVELILINNADYHSEFCNKNAIVPDWARTNPHPCGSIEYDAFQLCQVIENLASSRDILLHGHSRGAAVVLEAAKQRPDLTSSMTALLEAPVLPKAKTIGPFELIMKSGGYYFFPLLFNLIRHVPVQYRMLPSLAHPMTPQKRQIFDILPHVPKRYRTAIVNLKNIARWQRHADFDVYNHFKQIHIVIPERDAVLCRKAMLRSANQARHINLIQTRGTNHFISVEQPEILLTAAGLSRTANSVPCNDTVFG
ncbi:MAG TPA: alpha/beta hydrolase [Pseudomonadales bacterium]|nr:alpha/beta hydrolase [Pseudomonadales bacterium]